MRLHESHDEGGFGVPGNGMAQAFDMKDASVHQKKPLKMLTHV